jgi:hypothetical protein
LNYIDFLLSWCSSLDLYKYYGVSFVVQKPSIYAWIFCQQGPFLFLTPGPWICMDRPWLHALIVIEPLWYEPYYCQPQQLVSNTTPAPTSSGS